MSSAINGKNSCILLFGPSKGGKTYTLTGSKEENGLLERTVDDLLNLINSSNQIKSVHLLKMSVFMVFNDNINDLLSNNNKALYVYLLLNK